MKTTTPRTTNTTPPTLRGSSPWGSIDYIKQHADGWYTASTPRHGGDWISPEREAQIPAEFRPKWAPEGWYEEDCEVLIPCLIFAAELPADAQLRMFEIVTGKSSQYYKDNYGALLAHVRTIAGHTFNVYEASK